MLIGGKRMYRVDFKSLAPTFALGESLMTILPGIFAQADQVGAFCAYTCTHQSNTTAPF